MKPAGSTRKNLLPRAFILIVVGFNLWSRLAHAAESSSNNAARLTLERIFSGTEFDPEHAGPWKWQKQGANDFHSVIADPRFVDPDRFDFRLKPDSPALKLGFKPIDMSTVGPRRGSGTGAAGRSGRVGRRRAEARRQAPDLDHRGAVGTGPPRGGGSRPLEEGRVPGHRSSHRKTIENSASVTITRKIDWTTLIVVWVPTLSALPLTMKPRWQPTSATIIANTGAFARPVQ